MKKIITCIYAAAFMLLYSQSVIWNTLIPFESDDDAPVGIDITDTGEILVAYYTNGPNKCIWEGDSLTHSPIIKVASLDTSGDLINTENHGRFFNHNVTGIGRTENGYSLSGNSTTPVLSETNEWFYNSSAFLIEFNETGNDTIVYKTSDHQIYNIHSIETSPVWQPMAKISSGYSGSGGSGGATNCFVIDLKDSIIIQSDNIILPDSIDFEHSTFWINDIDMPANNNLLISGFFRDFVGSDLIYLICFDPDYNIQWEHYYDIGWSQSTLFSSVSSTTDGGCLAGMYTGVNHIGDNYLMKYDSEGTFEYSLGPYPCSFYYNHVEFIHYIGNGEYLFRIRGNNTVYKIVDTGTELIEDWSVELEGLKAVRAVENGFVAAGVRDEHIWVLSFDATTGIEDISGKPSVTTLYQNYPNPFNPATQIKFALAKTSDVKLSVYNISGQLVSQLASGVMNAGVHAVDFDGSRLNSGIYYYNLEVDGKKMTKRMLMIK